MEEKELPIVKFMANGVTTRILFRKSNDWNDVYMYDTSDDRKVERVWKGSEGKDKKEIVAMQLPYNGWRIMDKNSPDKTLIRDAIAAVHYIFDDDEVVKELIAAARPIWENNPDEPIPSSIPTPND